MLLKILIALIVLCLFGGGYNLSWKQRRVPTMTRMGLGYNLVGYRNTHLAWLLFGVAAVLAVVSIFVA